MAESVIGSAARSLRRSRLASPRNAKLRASCRSVTSSIPLVALSLGRAEAANSLIASNTQPGGALPADDPSPTTTGGANTRTAQVFVDVSVPCHAPLLGPKAL